MPAETEKLIAEEPLIDRLAEEAEALFHLSFTGHPAVADAWLADLEPKDVQQIVALICEAADALAAAEAQADEAEAKIAAFEADSETDDWLSHRHHQEWSRAEAAEAREQRLAREVEQLTEAINQALREIEGDFGSKTAAVLTLRASLSPAAGTGQ